MTVSSSPQFEFGLRTDGLRILVVFLAYLAAAKLGLHFASLHGSVSPFWPPSGIALVAILWGGSRMWGGVALGALVANFWLTDAPLPIAAGIAVGNTLEAIIAAGLFLRIRRITSLQHFAETMAWVAAALVAPVVSATSGVGTLWLSGRLPDEALGTLWLTWWLGDCIGILTVAPLIWILLEDTSFRRQVTVVDWLKALLLLLVAGLVCSSIFGQSGGAAYLFLSFPVLLLASIWFGSLGGQLMCVIIASFAVMVISDRSAPFEAASLNAVQLQLMGFLAVLAFTAQVTSVMARARCVRLPACLLLVGWLIGGWVFAQIDHERRKLDRVRFENLIAEAEQSIRQRLNIYTNALMGGASLFASSEEVTREEWRRYVDSLDLQERYPGILGIGVIFPVRESEKSSFLERVRADGAPNFEIHPVPGVKHPSLDAGGWDHFVITYIAPESVNRPALGLDLASEKNRFDAARFARDYGVPRLTEKITLVQNGEKPGFLLYVPMYWPEQPHTSVHTRRLASRGWVYAPFITESFLKGAIEKWEDRLELSFYEKLEPKPSELVYQSNPVSGAPYSAVTHLDLGGETFTCGWNPAPGFVQFRPEPVMNAVSLAIVPALLAGLVVSLQTLSRRATELAEERTRELRDLNVRLQAEMVERRNAETNAERAREAAEKASAAKSEFLATMSHEIRTPMNGIIGYTDLLAQSSETDEQRAWVRIIQNSGHALLTIINDILDFSKIEAGLMKLERIPFDPEECAREVVEIQQIQADLKRLGLSVEAADDLPKRIMGDPTRFRQILLNLVSNALKFTERGRVKITLRRTEAASGVGLRVEVADTGIGIPENKIGMLFHRFNQVDSSTTRRFGGTGLGLAICKHLVKMMNGAIGVDSKVGEGTTFWVNLPVEVCPDATPAAKSRRQVEMEKSTAGFGKRVLVAEDVSVNQKLATLLLTRLGCQVEVADNGRRAVELATSTPYDIIYMDCLMPEMDGFQATESIRQSPNGKRLPIIALTASALEGDREKCLAAGMSDYLTKPLTRSDFIRTLEKWTRRSPEM